MAQRSSVGVAHALKTGSRARRRRRPSSLGTLPLTFVVAQLPTVDCAPLAAIGRHRARVPGAIRRTLPPAIGAGTGVAAALVLPRRRHPRSLRAQPADARPRLLRRLRRPLSGACCGSASSSGWSWLAAARLDLERYPGYVPLAVGLAASAGRSSTPECASSSRIAAARSERCWRAAGSSARNPGAHRIFARLHGGLWIGDRLDV